jgi:hypothetical protein
VGSASDRINSPFESVNSTIMLQKSGYMSSTVSLLRVVTLILISTLPRVAFAAEAEFIGHWEGTMVREGVPLEVSFDFKGGPPPSGSCLLNPQASSRARSARSRLPLRRSLSGACQSLWPCSAVSQLPRRTPSFFTPLTRRMPAAKSALSRPQSAAS